MSEIKNYRNLIATMVLGGLWHSASWNFLIWGYIHGTALSLEKLWKWPEQLQNHWILRPIGFGVTFYLVCIAWVFFRAPDLDVSLYMITSMFGISNLGIETFSGLSWTLLIGLAAVHFVLSKFKIGQKLALLPAPIVAAICGLWLAAMLPFIPSESQPFIYFQF